MPERQIKTEIGAKACRHSLWLALFHAQDLGWSDISDSLLEMLQDVDSRRADLERRAAE